MRILTLLQAAICLAVIAAVPVAQAKEWTKVVVATEGAYPPYNMHAPDGKLIGFEVDLLANLCPRVKLDCSFIAQDWDGIIPGLQAGKYDAIMSGMSITAKRMQVIDFTHPYASSPSVFAVAKTGALAKMPLDNVRVSLDDKAATAEAVKALTPFLKGKVVGVQISTIQADLMNTYFKGVAEIRTYPTTEEHDLDLMAGRIDAELASQSQVVATMGKAGGEALTIAGPKFGGGLLGVGSGIGLRKSDPELKALLNKAIEESMADGSLKALSIKWFKTDLSPAS